MNEQQLERVATEVTSGLPGVTFESRENPNWQTFKVSRKVFLLLTDLPGHTVATVKVDPDRAVQLRQQYQEITPGYHTDKKHWVSASAGPGIDAELLRGLVVDSYGLVLDKLPKAEAAGLRARLSAAHAD